MFAYCKIPKNETQSCIIYNVYTHKVNINNEKSSLIEQLQLDSEFPPLNELEFDEVTVVVREEDESEAPTTPNNSNIASVIAMTGRGRNSYKHNESINYLIIK